MKYFEYGRKSTIVLRVDDGYQQFSQAYEWLWLLLLKDEVEVSRIPNQWTACVLQLTVSLGSQGLQHIHHLKIWQR